MYLSLWLHNILGCVLPLQTHASSRPETVVLMLGLVVAHYITSFPRDWLQFNSSIHVTNTECGLVQLSLIAILFIVFDKGEGGKKLVGVRVLLFLHWRFVSRMAESEADTPSTPIEFESKYFEFDGVRLPPFCRGKMEEIADFSLRSSDIWIVTYPKSGKRAAAHPL